MRRGAQYILIATIAVAAAAAGMVVSRSGTPDAALPGVAANAGESLLALNLRDAAGTEYPLENWRGRIMVINFWATWCPPCLREIPDFIAVSRRHDPAVVQFVGISIDNADNVREFDDAFQVPYPLLIGSLETLGLAAAFGNTAQALPFTVILDRQGAIRHVKLGTLNETELEGKIRALLSP